VCVCDRAWNGIYVYFGMVCCPWFLQAELAAMQAATQRVLIEVSRGPLLPTLLGSLGFDSWTSNSPMRI
jgi:hypothetical protein